MQSSKSAVLTLEDGTTYQGYSFGYDGPVSGEVVFNTAMTGYPESLTDPSYEGQILVTTFPQLGNYGVPPAGGSDTLDGYYESSRIHCRAIIAQDYAFHHSHWLADRSLAQCLKHEKITGNYGIDPRALTKHHRQHGSMLGTLTIEGGQDGGF
ncbi:MAG: carbamoyl-phosphate synthase (glutamine-hydrolyzing) small subunit, partial [Muribaculaceae bacterium]|nr:carbamoyl-phosphate synthase (glutamine-hydrolyzing) small subunit [Muribaculaceae bacterium]